MIFYDLKGNRDRISDFFFDLLFSELATHAKASTTLDGVSRIVLLFTQIEFVESEIRN